ncbi:hypothetical protein SAMN04515665_12072 [Blastococcus sp. DSM 46786]|nr:hypothetical protein SAMN04515665_12072 [Blastococcus sp. DSM 46786]
MTVDGTDVAERPAIWQRAALAVVAFAYLWTAVQGAWTLAGDLWGWAADSIFAWTDTTPSSGREALREHVLALAMRAACLAGVGVVLGLWWRRRLVLAVSGAGVAAALVVGVGVHWLAAPAVPDQPEEGRPRVCQEHSGGDNRCPGA